MDEKGAVGSGASCQERRRKSKREAIMNTQRLMWCAALIELCGISLMVPHSHGADVPAQFRTSMAGHARREKLQSIDFILAIGLTKDQALAALPICEQACRLYVDGYAQLSKIIPEEVKAYRAFLQEDRLNNGFSPEIESRAALLHSQAITTNDRMAAMLNDLAVDLWNQLSPEQQDFAAQYDPHGQAVFEKYATPKERREAAERNKDREKSRAKAIRRAAQRGERNPFETRGDHSGMAQAQAELNEIMKARHPRRDRIARYLLSPAAAETIWKKAGVALPAEVRKAVNVWRVGTHAYPLPQYERDIRTKSGLSREINNWNLVNGMHFSCDQIKELVTVAEKSRRLRIQQRSAKPKERMHKDDYNAAQVQLEVRAERILRPGQTEVLATYQPCLIPPKGLRDPVRVGQANDGTHLERWLTRARSLDATLVSGTVEQLISAETKHYGPLDTNDRENRKVLLIDVVSRAAIMSEVEFALQKEALVDQIQPVDQHGKLIAEMDRMRRAVLQPGRLSQMLLNDDMVAVLKVRYKQLKQGTGKVRKRRFDDEPALLD